MRLFIVDSVDEKSFFLNEEESKHIAKVLRMNIGDTLHLTTGNGNLHQAEIVSITPKRCEVQIVETIQNFEQRPYTLHIAICPTKNNDRLEWFLEKATEIGIDAVTLLTGENSERRNFNLGRYEKIIHSAVKQSLKSYIPQLSEGGKVKSFLKELSFEGQKFIAHCDNDFEQLSIKNELQPHTPTLVLIGPEGDFSKSEIELALSLGFKGISLTKSRLRTETAGVTVADYTAFVNLE